MTYGNPQYSNWDLKFWNPIDPIRGGVGHWILWTLWIQNGPYGPYSKWYKNGHIDFFTRKFRKVFFQGQPVLDHSCYVECKLLPDMQQTWKLALFTDFCISTVAQTFLWNDLLTQFWILKRGKTQLFSWKVWQHTQLSVHCHIIVVWSNIVTL